MRAGKRAESGMAEKIMLWIVLWALLLLTAFFTILSPYKYEWDTEIERQVSDDMVTALVFVNILFAILFAIFSLLTRRKYRSMSLFAITGFVVCIVRLAWLCFCLPE